MKKSEWKDLLEKELPYPRITIGADLKFDQILGSLPERDADKAEASQGDLKKERNTLEEAYPQKRRWGSVALGWAAAAAALILIPAAALWFVKPGFMEGLLDPGVVSGITSGLPGEPSSGNSSGFSPLPVEDTGAKLTGISWEDETTLTVTGVVPYMGRESFRLSRGYCTAPYGTYARLTLGDTDVDASDILIDGEEQAWKEYSESRIYTIGGCDTPEEFHVTWKFEIPPESRDSSAVLSLFETMFWGSSSDPRKGNRLTAEFALDLSALQAAVTPDGSVEGSYLSTMKKATPEEVLETERNADFTQGWYAMEPEVVSVEPGSAYPLECGDFFKLTFYGEPEALEDLGVCARLREETPSRDDAGFPYNLMTAYDRDTLNETFGPGNFTVLDGGFLDESFGNAKWYGVVDYSYMDFSRQHPGFDFSGRYGKNYRRVVFAVPGSAVGVADDASAMRDLLESGDLRFELYAVKNGDTRLIFDDVRSSALRQLQEEEQAYTDLTEFGVAPAESMTSKAETEEGLCTDSGVTLLSVTSEWDKFTASLSYPAFPCSALSDSPSKGMIEVRPVGSETALSHYASSEDEVVWDSALGDQVAIGDQLTVEAAFQAPPAGTRQVIVTLYSLMPEGETSIYKDGGLMGACVFAEFTVDLETQEAAATQTYLDRGYEKAAVREYITDFETGMAFVDHIFPRVVSGGGHSQTYVGYDLPEGVQIDAPRGVDGEDMPNWTVSFYTDTVEELPYEVRYFINGDLVSTVPLTQDDAEEIKGYGWLVRKEDYVLLIQDFSKADFHTAKPLKAHYSVTTCLDREVDLRDEVTVLIVNAETEDVVYNSETPDPPAHYWYEAAIGPAEEEGVS